MDTLDSRVGSMALFPKMTVAAEILSATHDRGLESHFVAISRTFPPSLRLVDFIDLSLHAGTFDRKSERPWPVNPFSAFIPHLNQEGFMRSLSLSKVYRFIEPGPVLLVTTSLDGQANVMTMSYHMVMQDAEPLIGCSLGPWNHSYKALRETRELVLAVPGCDLAATVVDIGNCSGDDVDKFTRFGLTPLPGKAVQAPLVGECLANFECLVADETLVEPYNLFIVRVVKAWINDSREERRTFHHQGNGVFVVDGEPLDFKARMTKWPTYIVEDDA